MNRIDSIVGITGEKISELKYMSKMKKRGKKIKRAPMSCVTTLRNLTCM